MKRLIGVSAVVSGLLLLIVPRFVLPPCEYEGFARMHCSDTAQAEMVTGALLLFIGALTLALKSPKIPRAGALTALALFTAAYFLPDKFGYCRSSRMPCNYGMVPGVRFIAVVSGIIMISALAADLRRSRKKGIAA